MCQEPNKRTRILSNSSLPLMWENFNLSWGSKAYITFLISKNTNGISIAKIDTCPTFFSIYDKQKEQNI